MREGAKEFFMKKTIVATPAIALAVALIFTACFIVHEPPEPEPEPEPVHVHQWQWVVTAQATPTADGRETETCKTCGAESGNTRIIEQTEPTVKTFSVTFNFELADGERICTATVKDERTDCGKQNLQQLGIVTVIKEATMGAFNTTAANVMQKNRFRTVFGVDGGVTIIVNNPATPYKMSITDRNTIYMHIDYLKSSPADIQQNIFDTISFVTASLEPEYPHTIQ
jgi:hypothetical protein